MALTAADKLEIIELVSRYCRAADSRDPEGVAALFTDDGVLEANGRVLGDSKAGILAFSEGNRNATLRRRHYISNAIVDGDGAVATINCLVAVYDVTDGVAKAPYLLGEYHDDLAKTPDGWRFTHRRLSTIAGQASVQAPKS